MNCKAEEEAGGDGEDGEIVGAHFHYYRFLPALISLNPPCLNDK